MIFTPSGLQMTRRGKAVQRNDEISAGCFDVLPVYACFVDGLQNWTAGTC